MKTENFTKVKVIDCPMYPQYVGMVCKVVQVCEDVAGVRLYKLQSEDGKLCKGWATSEDFEVVE